MNFLTIREVFLWLTQKEKGSIVGVAGTPTHCPLANCYRDVRKGPSMLMTVPRSHVWMDEGMESVPTPSWACEFMLQVDSLPPAARVTREQAMDILIKLAPTVTSEIEQSQLVAV